MLHSTLFLTRLVSLLLSRLSLTSRSFACFLLQFESYTRNTLDLQAVPVIKELTHLPIIIDPSHAGGKWWLVNPMAKAAVAAGCDGLMIEVHNNPEKALCDGPQSLKPAKFEQLMKELKPIADAVGKEL